MDGEPGYDTTNLVALRETLERLNAAALGIGLIAARPEAPPVSDAPRARAGSVHKGKAGARRLLTILGRVADDESPEVPGTLFTESGVVRLLGHLRKRRSWRFRFLRRLHRFLTRPVGLGARTSAGVSVERLQVVSRQLQEIKAHGWHRFQSVRATRRGRQALSSRLDPPAEPREPAVAAPNAAARNAR